MKKKAQERDEAWEQVLEEVLPKLRGEEPEDNFEEFEEDFDLKTGEFQVWAIGYDEDDQITDFDFPLFSSKDADEAVAYAKTLVEDAEIEMITELTDIPEDVAYVEIEVEEVVEVEGIETNQGSIYHGRLIIKEN